MSTISLTITDGVARLVLDRPESRNAISLELARDLADAVTKLDGARVVVISGSGPAFCVGGDLKSFVGVGDLPQHLRDVTASMHAAVEHLAALPVPVIAAVHGVAAGAGMSLACACDLVIAAESARFVFAFSAIGLTPDASSTWFLPRRVGLGRALDIALLNRPLSAQEAHEWGIVTRVVADDAFEREVEAVAAHLAAGPTAALGRAKQLLHASSGRTLHDQLIEEREALAEAGGTADGIEGIRAFIEKRRPVYRG